MTIPGVDSAALGNTQTLQTEIEFGGWQAIGTMGANLSYPMSTITALTGQSGTEVYGITTTQPEQFPVSVPEIKVVHANYASTGNVSANAATGEAAPYSDMLIGGRIIDATQGTSRKIKWNGDNLVKIGQWGITVSDSIPYQTVVGSFIGVQTYVGMPVQNAYVPSPKNFAASGGGVSLYSIAGSATGNKTYGFASTISNTLTTVQGYYHSIVIGYTGKNRIKNVFIVGDSNLVSLGDAGCYSGGWAARVCLKNTNLSVTQTNQATITTPYPFLLAAKQGESSVGFALDQQHQMRVQLSKWFTNVIYALGTNDFSAGLTAAQMEAAVTKMAVLWTTMGINFIACTVTPATSTTNGWLYNADLSTVQTVGTYDGVRIAYNTWLRSSLVAAVTAAGGNGNLVKIFDLASVIEVNKYNVATVNGGYTMTPSSSATPYYSGTVTTGGSASQLTDTSSSSTVNAYRGMVIYVKTGTNAGLVAGITGNTAAGVIGFNKSLTGNFAVGDTYQIWGPTTGPFQLDSLHLTSLCHAYIQTQFPTSYFL